MSKVSERYARLAAAFTEKVKAVPADRWESPSPCEGWTARDVVRHVVDTHGMFLGFIGREFRDVPSVDDDPVAAWEAARDIVQGHLDDPETARTEYDGFAGKLTFEQGIDRFICFDQLVHAWDLARAAGIDESLDPEEVRRVLDVAPQFGEMLRAPGVCGPEVEVPPDADEQTRMLAFLGRRV